MADLTVAHTIVAQIGRPALFMLGALGSLAGDDRSLSFKVQGSPRGVTMIRVILTPEDTYDVEAWLGRGAEQRFGSAVRGIYDEMLRATVAELTGLAVSL